MSEGKEHLSIVICGHVDSGKSTTTGRLLFELGGIPERELEKLKVCLIYNHFLVTRIVADESAFTGRGRELGQVFVRLRVLYGSPEGGA